MVITTIKINGHDSDGHDCVYSGLAALNYIASQSAKYALAGIIGVPIKIIDICTSRNRSGLEDSAE
jgi:hypothetical protein